MREDVKSQLSKQNEHVVIENKLERIDTEIQTLKKQMQSSEDELLVRVINFVSFLLFQHFFVSETVNSKLRPSRADRYSA